jgi:hypothetical protein
MAPEAADHRPALERFWEYLHLPARLQLDARWQGEVDLSGVGQQTLLPETTRTARVTATELSDELAES